MFRLMVMAVLSVVLLANSPLLAQEDGLNLPAELYILLNEGRVERYGLGAAGVATVTPSEDFVVDFGVAPGNVWIAYRTETSLKLHNMLRNETRVIEEVTSGIPPFRGRGATIAWSPDAEALAYTMEYGIRVYFVSGAFTDVAISPLVNLVWSPNGQFLAAEAEDNVWWVYRREGTNLVLQSAIVSSVGAAWVDPAVLMFAPAEGGLAIMDLANANTQTTLADSTSLYRLPAMRPDGSVSIFARPVDDASETETTAYLHDIVFATGASLRQVSETGVDLTAMRWAPGGTLLVALRGGVLALVDPSLGQGFSLPATGVVDYGWGTVPPAAAAALPMSQALYLLGSDFTGVNLVWRAAADGSAPAPMLLSEADVETFAASGALLVFVSDGQLWLLDEDDEVPTSLLPVEDVRTVSLSTAQNMIAYDSGDQIVTLPVSGGEPQTLLEGYSAPHYTSEPGTMLIRIADGDLARLSLDTGEITRLGNYNGAVILADGRTVAFGAPTAGGTTGLYLLESGAPTLMLLPAPGTEVVDAVEAAPGVVRALITRRDWPTPLQAVDIPLAGEIAALPGPGFIDSPQLSADGRYVAGFVDGAGTLVVYDFETGEARIVQQPPRVHQFRWVPLS